MFVITGASGSGKSEYAEELACRLALRDRIPEKLYLATMENRSAEAKKRIARHRRLRKGKGFVTMESPLGLGKEALQKKKDAVLLLECTSNLLANLMFSGGLTGRQAVEEMRFQLESAAERFRHVIVVTNEIFSDGADYTGEMQEYVRALGAVNCRLAERADAFCEVVYTIPVFLKGEKACRF